MKKSLLLILPLLMLSCNNSAEKTSPEANSSSFNAEEAKKEINDKLEYWHKAAADADFDGYFNHMTEDGIFIGTDATENWNIAEFQNFSKPYFDSGTAWDFKTLERNIYTAEKGEIAWFDELLDTWMGICRGSGVVIKDNGEWKVKHYVLSATIPNEDIQKVIAAKKERDSTLILKFQ